VPVLDQSCATSQRTQASTEALDSTRSQFRHPESGFGHDKSRATAPYRDLAHRPTIFFCGDGVSDLSAAKAADLLFVKVIPGYIRQQFVSCRTRLEC
jgi:2-hydroxy-3-keto-5-methylthiopentenyl-1-phosphate phosphatase